MAYKGKITTLSVILLLVLVGMVHSSTPEEKVVKSGENETLQVADARAEPRHLTLDEDYPHHGSDVEYANEVSEESFKADKHLKGNQNMGDVDEEHSTDMHHDRGTHEGFSQGGGNFNKHHKEKVADNKELENVKQHDAGEKFGAQALKEHKLGKHKEKSKGHKLHGFKNTYHKEEYGDHKTFHDEFLDTDHHHNYDDHHEHRQLQGGKFTKGFKHEGKNKNFDEGDERHEWGKDGHDTYDDGKYEKNGHNSKHHHGHKKHEGHQEASSHEGKHSHHKQKKGNGPHHDSEISHHGPHQPQYYGHESYPHHSANSHSYHGHETFPSDNHHIKVGGHYSGDHGSYAHHEGRSAPLAKKTSDEDHRSVYVKPAAVKELDITPLNIASVVPSPQSQPERQRLERMPLYVSPAPEVKVPLYESPVPEVKVPLYESPVPEAKVPFYEAPVPKVKVPRQQNERQYSQPIVAKQHQFYHRWPEHEKHRFHNPINHHQSNSPLNSGPSEPRYNQHHNHNIHAQHHNHNSQAQHLNHNPQTHHLNHNSQAQHRNHNSHLQQHNLNSQALHPHQNINSHVNLHPKHHHQDHLSSRLHSKPYNWQDRGASHQKHHVVESSLDGPVSSRFDAGEQRIPEQYSRPYVPAPSQQHYLYNYRN